jgi:hypothetical protein
MKYNINGYKWDIRENYPNKIGYRIIHNGNQFCRDYTFKTIHACIETIKHIVDKPNQYIIKKSN